MQILAPVIILIVTASSSQGTQEQCLQNNCTETSELAALKIIYSIHDLTLQYLKTQYSALNSDVNLLQSETTDLSNETEKEASQIANQTAEITSLKKRLSTLKLRSQLVSEKNAKNFEKSQQLLQLIPELENENKITNDKIEEVVKKSQNVEIIFSEMEQKSSSFSEVTLKNQLKEGGKVYVKEGQCKWVQVTTDVSSSAKFGSTNVIVLKNGAPIIGREYLIVFKNLILLSGVNFEVI